MFNLNRISKKFRDDFANLKNIPMGIYGMGNNARAILTGASDFNISCVIVQNAVGGMFCGKNVKLLEDAIADGVAVIVLAAEADIEIIIYERIREVCIQNSIDVYGLHLGDMKHFFNDRCFLGLRQGEQVSREEVIGQIDNHEIISFDIFDTLVMRKTFVPQDVFCIVQGEAKQKGINVDGFPFIRIHSELTNPNPTPNIDEIYSYMCQVDGIDSDICEELKKIELAVEEKVIIPRVEVCELFRYAKDEGKKIYLISDMYLQSDTLEQILYKNGITGYEKLFVSCDYGTTKNENMFNVFINECRGSSYLHIGDNRKVDGLNSLINGMNAVTIPSASALLDTSCYKGILVAQSSVNDRMMAGLFCEKVFRNPFGQKYKVNNAYEFGYLFIAPLITAFMIWAINEMKKQGFTTVLFAARDGYLFKQLFDIYFSVMDSCAKPEGIYFYTSRRACLRAYCRNRKGLDEILEQYSFTMEDIYRNYSDAEAVNGLSEEDVYAKAQIEYEGYQAYIDSINIQKEEKIAFIDLVSGGTCQYYLEEMFFGKMTGLYLCRGTSWVKRVPEIKSMIDEYPDYIGGYFSKIDQVKLLEAIMTSNEPSLAGFGPAGKKIMLKDKMTTDYKCFVKEVQQGIIDYFGFFIRNLYVPGVPINTSVIRAFLDFRNNTDVDENILKNIHIEDELMGTYF